MTMTGTGKLAGAESNGVERRGRRQIGRRRSERAP